MTRWEAVSKLLDNPTFGVEVGVKEGKFSAYMLGKFPGLKMVGVDPYEVQPVSDEIGYQTYEDWSFNKIMDDMWRRVGPHRDRFSLLREYSADAAPKVTDGTADFVFIDAQHTYKGVSEDIALWMPKLKPGGILCGHDYDPTRPRFADVMRAVDEAFTSVNTTDDFVWWVRV